MLISLIRILLGGLQSSDLLLEPLEYANILQDIKLNNESSNMVLKLWHINDLFYNVDTNLYFFHIYLK